MNEEVLLAWLKSDDGQVVHVGVFVSLVAGGFGLPIPEDIPLLLSGVAAAKNIVSLRLIWINCYLGVLLADQIIYWFGFFFGRRILIFAARSSYFGNIGPSKIREVRTGLRNRRFSLIFLSRHFFPIRTLTFLSAGAPSNPLSGISDRRCGGCIYQREHGAWSRIFSRHQSKPPQGFHSSCISRIYIWRCFSVWLFCFICGRGRRVSRAGYHNRQSPSLNSFLSSFPISPLMATVRRESPSF